MASGVVDICAWSIPVRSHRRRPSVVLQSSTGKSVEPGTDDSLFNLFDSKKWLIFREVHGRNDCVIRPEMLESSTEEDILAA